MTADTAERFRAYREARTMPERLTVAQSAARLGVTPGRVRHFIADGRLPAERFGNAWAINPDDLDKIHRAQGWPKGKPRKASSGHGLQGAEPDQ